MRKILVLLVVFVIAFAMPVAAETAAKVVFDISEVDADGNFAIDLTIYNATFKGFIGTLTYDSSVVVPVSETFEKIAEIPAKAYNNENAEIEDWLIDDASKIDEGKLNLIYILNTDVEYPNSIISSKFQALASEDGLNVARLKFKKIADGAPAFGLEENKFMLINSNGSQACEVQINIPKSMGESVIINVDGVVKTMVSNESETDAETMQKRVQARSNGTVFLQIDNYATVSDSILKWIDKENKAVMPYIKNDYTMVPLRYIAEELNSNVSYNDETREITIENTKTILKFTVDSVDYTDDGLKKTADIAPEIVNSRTFVPLRTVSEALNRSVEWIEADRMVVITSREYPWDNENKVEKELLNEIKLMISPMVRDFAYLSESVKNAE